MVQLNALAQHNIVADFAIGDGDSLNYSKLQDFVKIHIFGLLIKILTI